MTAQLMSAFLLVLGMAITLGGVVARSRRGEQWEALQRGDQSSLERRDWATFRSWLLLRQGKYICSYIVFLFCGLVTPALAQPVIANGDFETNAGFFTSSPGYVGQPGNPPEISGWNTHTGLVGINPGDIPSPNNSLFRNNGADLTNVAFLQFTASLSQTISGFTVGDNYIISFDYNSRNQGVTTDNPNMQMEIFGQLRTINDINPVDPAGVFTTPYRTASFIFTAPDTTGALTFFAEPATPGADSALLLDNVKFTSLGRTIPEPSTWAMMLLGFVGLGFLGYRSKVRQGTLAA
jgi:PEP-CTERM motif